MDNTPIKLIAPIKDYIWGGQRLITDFNKQTTLDKAAESWELSTHPDGQSIVADGAYKGCTLSEYIQKNGGVGTRAEQFDFFPILIKLIDAKNDLSIQVHPNDEYALRVEHEYGKTEMWYIVDCKEDSYLYYGLNRTVTKDEFKQRIENNTLLEILNKVPVHKGDVFFIPSGTIHAICSGILICEVQQNSNTTYRVYDYDRRDKDGNTRQLHIEKAVDVATLSPSPTQKTPENGILASCEYFTVEKVSCQNELEIPIDDGSFRSLVVTDGSGTLTVNNNAHTLLKGDSIFIPAQGGKIMLNGELEGILSYL